MLSGICPLRTLPDGKPVDRAGRAFEVLAAYVQVDHGGDEAGVSEQFADREQIDAGFEHTGGIGMPECMGRGGFEDPGSRGGQLAGFLNGGGRERCVGSLAGKEIVGWSLNFPIASQLVQQSWRRGHATCLAAFAAGHQDLCAVPVDIGDSQMGCFGES